MRTRDVNKENRLRHKALEMIVKKGFDGLSMQELATSAGVSPATIYIYFKDRDDLILQLALDVIHRMTEATLKGFDSSMHFDEGLKIQWINRARYCLENPLDMHFLEQIRYSPYHERVWKYADQTFLKSMKKFVSESIKKKELVKVPLEIYWSIAFAPLYQLVKFQIQKTSFPGGTPFTLDEKTMMKSLDLVLKALKP
jgi:AcrR family transcriptional regulator